tara:strand:- start:14897 stop:15340 length:444 start_codon:yes stop_codon:yes gene_type:complete
MKTHLNPPALIFENRPAGSKGGSTMFVVMLPDPVPAKMLQHELHHVKQWWVVTIAAAVLLFALATVVPLVSYYVMALSVGVMGALYRFSAAFRFRAEAAAYAATYTADPNELAKYANTLAAPLYSTGRSVNECRGAIASRIDTGRLF